MPVEDWRESLELKGEAFEDASTLPLINTLLTSPCPLSRITTYQPCRMLGGPFRHRKISLMHQI
jgi:hypothetical protein